MIIYFNLNWISLGEKDTNQLYAVTHQYYYLQR